MFPPRPVAPASNAPSKVEPAILLASVPALAIGEVVPCVIPLNALDNPKLRPAEPRPASGLPVWIPVLIPE